MRPPLTIISKGCHIKKNNWKVPKSFWKTWCWMQWGHLHSQWWGKNCVVQGEVQERSRTLPCWCWQGGPGLNFLWCRWWRELSTGSPSQWWSHQHCWWKHLWSSLPCPSRTQQVWRCPVFEDPSNKSLETEQRVERNDTEAVGAVHLPIASYMHYGSLAASDLSFRWSFGTNLSKPLLGSLNEAAEHHLDGIIRGLCAVGLILCRGITNSPHPS